VTRSNKKDLKRLYQLVWSGDLTNINGTPIRLVKPFHAIGTQPEALIEVARPAAVQPVRTMYATAA
jgi:hypothetical protein